MVEKSKLDTTEKDISETTEATKTLSKKEKKALEFKQKLKASKKKSKSEKSEGKKEEESKKRKRDEKDESKTTKPETKKVKSATTETPKATNSSENTNTESKNKKKRKKRKSGSGDGSDKGPRFILFVGNLPFSYQVQELETHFQSCKPDVIRPRDKKGFAFVEYSGDDASRRMTIALSKLHHSLFMGRKINVELTAGGGGNTQNRKMKIQEKNAKLEESRKADFEKQEKERKEKEKRKHIKFGAEAPVEKETGASIHPSRQRLIKE